jgi:hypothetical protein
MSTTALAVFPPSASALALGVSTPSATLVNFGPGLHATGSGTLTVSTVLAPWTLKVADASGNAGHLAPGAVGCAGSEPHTANALSVSASGILPTTSGSGTVVIGASATTVANGTAIDTVNVAYALDVGLTEVMRAGCVFSTTVTYTVQ